MAYRLRRRYRMRTMLRWTEKQRDLVADKLADLANVAAGAMVFGQLLTQQQFSWASLAVAAVGLLVWALLALVVVVLSRGGTP